MSIDAISFRWACYVAVVLLSARRVDEKNSNLLCDWPSVRIAMEGKLNERVEAPVADVRMVEITEVVGCQHFGFSSRNWTLFELVDLPIA